MEEGEYKLTYNELASVRCVFEKALTNNHAKCHLSKHFCLADREGYSCKNAESSLKCNELLQKLRKKSVFALKLRNINGSLPHNMEIRVQVGGLIGLVKLIDAKIESHKVPLIDDINGVLNKVNARFGSLDVLPYSEIVQSVVQFQGRRRQQR